MRICTGINYPDTQCSFIHQSSLKGRWELWSRSTGEYSLIAFNIRRGLGNARAFFLVDLNLVCKQIPQLQRDCYSIAT